MPEGALFAVSNAAVYGAVLALQAELRSRPQRINEVRPRLAERVRRSGRTTRVLCGLRAA